MIFKNNKSNLIKNREYTKKEIFSSSILGFVIGDALGVPVEFQSRETLKHNKVNDMEEYGTHNQPKGTWSDDSSMMFATMDAIINTPINKLNSYSMFKNIMDAFIEWKYNGKYTPFDNVFDIGNSTSYALENYKNKLKNSNLDIIDKAELKKLISCGYDDISSNGNGSLMRILPLALYCNKIITYDVDMIEFIFIGSALTHSHIYSKIGCLIYSKYVEYLLDGLTKEVAYIKLKKWFNSEEHIIQYKDISLNIYKRLLVDDISKLKENDIKSSGYVVDTLEATLWTILTTSSYKEAVLKAVNLGDDTDTIGALVGGLAGLIYGTDSLPIEWLNAIQNKEYILDIIDNFNNKLDEYDQYYYDESSEIATKDSWKILDMPNENKIIKLNINLTSENINKLKKGHIPKEMEDHWFAYYDNNKFYIYRSWTGYCLYVIDIPEDGNITNAIVNRNKEQYKNEDDNEDIRVINNLIYWYAGERKKALQAFKEK